MTSDEMLAALHPFDRERAEAVAELIAESSADLRRAIHERLFGSYCPHCFGPARNGERMCPCERDE